MSMEVLLRRTIDGVGEVGEVVSVKPGYARNFLLPKGYAAVVSPESLRRIEKDKQTEAVRQAEEARARRALAERLEELTLTIEARAGEDGHLYGSVGARQVAEALKREGFPFEERQIRMEPVRELGAYEAPVHLSREHTVDVKVWVVQDAREAAEEAAEAAEREAAEAASPKTESKADDQAAPPTELGSLEDLGNLGSVSSS